jgi:hypothetical protein
MTVATGASSSAIRKVDFKNFAYAFGSTPLTVSGGVFDSSDPNEPMHLEVVDVDHGDLDGDGIAEAVVSLTYNTGGTGNFTEGRVFKLVGGKPTQITEFGGGDRADGGLEDVVITTGGVLRAQFFGGNSGSCCPEFVQQTDFRLRGKTLVVTPGKKIVRGVDRIGDTGVTGKAIKFRPGTSGSLIYVDGGSSGFFDARKGQTVTLDVKSPSSWSYKLLLVAPNSATVAKATNDSVITTKLPLNGRYRVVVDGSPDTSVRILLDIR